MSINKCLDPRILDPGSRILGLGSEILKEEWSAVHTRCIRARGSHGGSVLVFVAPGAMAGVQGIPLLWGGKVLCVWCACVHVHIHVCMCVCRGEAPMQQGGSQMGPSGKGEHLLGGAQWVSLGAGCKALVEVLPATFKVSCP